MIFGDRLRPAAGTGPAEWLEGAASLESWTVGGLLPKQYESHVLIEPAPPGLEDWWEAQRTIMVAVADVLAAFTDTPDAAWFAIWEGHGYDSGQPCQHWTDDHHGDDGAGTLARAEALEAVGGEARPSVRDALRLLPRFDRPTRTYYLLGGTVADVDSIRWPTADHWFAPDLWWPDDHRWFVGTDVDFWTSYVGGSRAMTDALAARLPGRCAPVALEDRLRLEE